MAASPGLSYWNGSNYVDVTDATPLPTTATLSGDLTVPADTSSSLTDGSVTATTTAAVLGASLACTEILIQNDPTVSTDDILVGSATSQSMRLRPGDNLPFRVNNRNILYVKSVSGTQTVNYHAR